MKSQLIKSKDAMGKWPHNKANLSQTHPPPLYTKELDSS